MASQGEREPGVVGMDEGVLESMAQDGDPEQEMLVVEEQEQFFPQMDPEPEMGATAAAEYDTPPPLPTSVKFPPRSPAKPRPTEAIRLRRGRLKSTEWGKC